MNNIKEKINLDKIPHYTALQKFVSKIPSSLSNIILSRTLKLFYSNISVDTDKKVILGWKISHKTDLKFNDLRIKSVLG